MTPRQRRDRTAGTGKASKCGDLGMFVGFWGDWMATEAGTATTAPQPRLHGWHGCTAGKLGAVARSERWQGCTVGARRSGGNV